MQETAQARGQSLSEYIRHLHREAVSADEAGMSLAERERFRAEVRRRFADLL